MHATGVRHERSLGCVTGMQGSRSPDESHSALATVASDLINSVLYAPALGGFSTPDTE